MMPCRCFGLLFAISTLLCAQTAAQQQKHIAPLRRHVDPSNSYHRVICVVPYAGSGTKGDPKLPLYLYSAPGLAPVARQAITGPLSGSRSGIIAFKHLPSDDKSMALVEYVAIDRTALLPILNDKSILSFEKGKHSRVEVETALKKYKKDFVLEQFGVAVR